MFYRSKKPLFKRAMAFRKRLYQVISIKGESYRLKERKEMMTGSTKIVNTLFETKE